MTPSKRKLDVNIVQSNFHIEITPRYLQFDYITHAIVFTNLIVMSEYMIGLSFKTS